jgi:LSD1 subclass zinc finger protein
MYSNVLVNCSNCRTPLQLPPGAGSIRCALCQAITLIADPRALPHQPSPSPHAPPPPSPYNQVPPGPLPNIHGRKKAVIVGISYKFSRHELKGCINDAKCMRYLLINKYTFPESSIVMLTGTCDLDFSLFDDFFRKLSL